ncbi:MAG: cysteine desulfurase [Planctomycetes bacterium]|nr:cysteine desulfurase [Planctomycetota bacterium]
MSPRLDLDRNATAPTDPTVVEAMVRLLGEPLGNPSSPHTAGRRARDVLEAARDGVARTLGCRAREIVFTSGGTEACHLAVQGAARARVGSGRRLVVSAVEHPAVLDAADALVPEGFEVVRVAPGPDGQVDAARFVAACGPGTTVAALMLANHETGALQPVREVAAALRPRGVTTVCDAALAPGLLEVAPEALGVDLLALSSHKVGGPTGVGALYVRRRTRLVPLQRGGVQEDRVRGGTENVVGAHGFALALARAVAARPARAAACAALRARLLERVLALPGTRLVGPHDGLPSTATVAFEGCEGESMLVNLDLEGIAVSTGSACAVGGTEASPVLLAMGLSPRVAASTLRFSVGDDLRLDDVDRVGVVVARVVGRLRSLSR